MSGLARLGWVLILLSAPLTKTFAAESEAVSAAPRPCTQITEFSQFDFWLGEWAVHTADGTLVGSNRIQKEPGGCALVERWTNSTGGTGLSINYYDPQSKQWVQDWVGADGSLILIRGGLTEDGSMLLEGTLTNVGEGTTNRFRGRWTLLEDGRVRQAFEVSPDEGVTWNEWFVGFYRRTAEPE